MDKANRNKMNKKKDSKKPDSKESKSTGESPNKKTEAKADGRRVTNVSQAFTEGTQTAGHSPLLVDKEKKSTDTAKEQILEYENFRYSLKLSKLLWEMPKTDVINESYQELEAKYRRREISTSEYNIGLSQLVSDNLESNECYKSEHPELREKLDELKSYFEGREKLVKFTDKLSIQNLKDSIFQTLSELMGTFGYYGKKKATCKLSRIDKTFGLEQDQLKNVRKTDGATSDDGTQKETSTSQISTEGMKGQTYGNESTSSAEYIQLAEQSAQNESEDKDEEKRSQKDTDVQDIQSKSEIEELAQEPEDCAIREENISEACHSSEKEGPKFPKKAKKDRVKFQLGMREFMADQTKKLNQQVIETCTSQILTESVKDGNESTGSTEYSQLAGKSAQNENEDKNEEKEEKPSKKDADVQNIQSQSEIEELAEDCEIREENISDASHSSEKDKPKNLKKQLTPENREEALKVMKKQWDEGAVGLSKETFSDIETHEKRKDSEEIGNVTTEDEVSKNAEVDNEPKEKIIQLKKGDNIHFEYDNDFDRHVFAAGNYYLNSVQEKQRILFCFKDEAIQVLFTSDRVFVSTPSSEFSFLIRRPVLVDSTEKATQTDTHSVTSKNFSVSE